MLLLLFCVIAIMDCFSTCKLHRVDVVIMSDVFYLKTVYTSILVYGLLDMSVSMSLYVMIY